MSNNYLESVEDIAESQWKHSEFGTDQLPVFCE